jgi:hypothetical protein
MSTRTPSILFLCVANSARRLHWPIPDPASPDPTVPRAEMLRRFRTARDALRGKLEAFAATELT